MRVLCIKNSAREKCILKKYKDEEEISGGISGSNYCHNLAGSTKFNLKMHLAKLQLNKWEIFAIFFLFN